MKPKFLRLPVLGMLVLCVVGCAVKPTQTPEQALVERAHAYWEAAKLRDWASKYHLESGSLDGKLKPDAEQFREPPSSLLSYEFKHIQLHDKDAEIEVDAQFSVPQLHKPFAKRITNYWTLIDGQWYHRTGDTINPLTGK